MLRLRLSAASLNPAATTFSATNLPPGAILEPSGAFQWKPNPNEAGVYPAVHFAATDGLNTASEDVTFTVAEGGLALCGTAERLNAPLPGIAIQLAGGGSKRVTYSDAAGRFCFFYLVQDQYTLTVGRASKRMYDATPLRVIVDAGDVNDVHFVVRKIS